MEKLTGTASLAARAASDAESAANDAESAASSAASAASDAESAATMVGYDVDNVAQLVQDLQRVVDDLQNDSVDSFVARVARVRVEVWWAFTVDTWERSSTRAERLARDLHSLLSVGISLDQAHNSWELSVWEGLLSNRKAQRRSRGTMKWWEAAIKEVGNFRANPVYDAPKLPDLRAEIRADLDKALDDPNSLTRQFNKPDEGLRQPGWACLFYQVLDGSVPFLLMAPWIGGSLADASWQPPRLERLNGRC